MRRGLSHWCGLYMKQLTVAEKQKIEKNSRQGKELATEQLNPQAFSNFMQADLHAIYFMRPTFTDTSV